MASSAANLARAGLRVAVLERNPVIGGGTRTHGPMLPGHRCSLQAKFFIRFSTAPLAWTVAAVAMAPEGVEASSCAASSISLEQECFI